MLRTSSSLPAWLFAALLTTGCPQPSEGDCSAATCTGCCADGVCQSGSAIDACGTGGATCSTCAEADTCESGRCIAEGVDAGPRDADVPADGGPGSDAGCTPETDAELCEGASAECGALAVTDRCGNARSPTSCGDCVAPEVCGGASVANRCDPLSCEAGEVVCHGQCIAACLTCPATPRPACPDGFELYDFSSEMVSPVGRAPANARLVIDEGGVVHAAWTRRLSPVGIEYATNQSGSWVVEPVADASALPDASVFGARFVLNGCEPAVAYLRQHSQGPTGIGQAFLSVRTPSGWVEERIPVPDAAGSATPSTEVRTVDLVGDGAGGLIAAVRAPSRIVLMTRSAGGAWTAEETGLSTSTIAAPVLTYDAALGPVLAYGLGSGPLIAYRDGGAWVTSAVPDARRIRSTSSNNEARVAVAVDASGTVHLAWGASRTGGGETLWVSRREGAVWTAPQEVAGAASWVADSLNLWIDSEQRARLTHQSFGGGGSGEAESWAVAEDDRWLRVGISTGVSGTAVGRTDASGRLYLLVGDQSGLTLRAQECVACPNGFCPEVVAAAGVVGDRSAIALDAAGNPQISYGQINTRGLRVARWDGAGWVRQLVDPDVTSGTNDLVIDGSGITHVSYWNISDQVLQYARGSGADWSVEVVDDAGRVGGFNSIALDAADRPHIAYFELDDGALKYARWTGTAWDIAVVDTVDDVGRYASLALDAADQPHIAYADFTNDDLRYARPTGAGSWTIETVDDADAGRFCSLALDRADRAHISYYQNSDSDLLYAHWTGTEWSREVVISEGSVAIGTALALDDDDEPRIVFTDFDEDSIRYIERNGSGWSAPITIDAFSSTCSNVDVAVDAAGLAHVSYCDPNRSDLLYARQ